MERHDHHRPRPHRANPGVVTSPGAKAACGYFICSVCLVMPAVSCLMGGAILMPTGYDSSFGTGSGIAGTVLLCVGAGLVITCSVSFCCAIKRGREPTVASQQVAEGTTLGYDQPSGAQPVVQPLPPPGTVAYGPGGGPIASQAAPPGVTIVYGPGQPQTQAGFQPQPQQYPNQPYPATAPYPPALTGVPYPSQPVVPYPPQPVTELAGQPEPPPPPSYDEVVKTQSVAVNMEVPTT